MAHTPDDRPKHTQSKLGRGLGSLIPVPIQRVDATPTASASPEGGTDAPRVDRSNQVESKPITVSREDGAGARGGTTSLQSAVSGPVITFLPVNSIVPGKYQPRGAMDQDALEALAKSIEQSGLMQPVVVRPSGSSPGMYELIAGERRWRAIGRLGRLDIPAIIQVANDREAAELSLIENLQREDLNPMDRAAALRRLADEFALTHGDLASRVGLDRTTVTNLLRLNDLDGACAAHIRSGALALGHAKVLLGIAGLSARRALADEAVAGGWSVRALESTARERGGVPRGTSNSRSATRPPNAHIADLRRQLEEHLGTRVELRVGRKKGAGELRVKFFSLDEFDGLMQRIGFQPPHTR